MFHGVCGTLLVPLLLRKAPALPVLESWEAECSCLKRRMNNSKNQRVRFVVLRRDFRALEVSDEMENVSHL